MNRLPDWKRLGARFGVPDVCVDLVTPGTASLDGRPLAENVVALREGDGEVRVQVACGLVLHVRGAGIARVDRDARAVALERRRRAS